MFVSVETSPPSGPFGAGFQPGAPWGGFARLASSLKKFFIKKFSKLIIFCEPELSKANALKGTLGDARAATYIVNFLTYWAVFFKNYMFIIIRKIVSFLSECPEVRLVKKIYKKASLRAPLWGAWLKANLRRARRRQKFLQHSHAKCSNAGIDLSEVCGLWAK